MKNAQSSFSINLWQRYAVLIVTLLIIAVSPVFAEQLTSGVSFSQVSFTASNPPEKYSHYAQVSVDYTMLYGEGYVNVERYENGKAAGWVVKNLPVINGSVLSGFSTMFDLGASGYQSSISAYVDFSPTPLLDDSSLRHETPAEYRLAQAELPLAGPAAPGTVKLSGKGCKLSNAYWEWTKGDFGTKKASTDGKGKLEFCAQDSTGTDWTKLKVASVIQNVQGDDETFFAQSMVLRDKNKQPYGVCFSGTNGNRPGIKNTDTFMVTITGFIAQKEVKITPQTCAF